MNKKQTNDPRTLLPFLLSSSLLIIALIGIMSTIPTFQESFMGKGRDIRKNETLPKTVLVADYDSLDILLEQAKSTGKNIFCYWDDPKSANTKVGRIAYWKEGNDGIIGLTAGSRVPESFTFAGKRYYDKQDLIRHLQSVNFRIPIQPASPTHGAHRCQRERRKLYP